MAKQVIIISEAWLDINEASDYYEQISSALRERFETELIQSLEKLETGIVSFKIYKQQYRCMNLPSFPFKVYYKENVATIIVAAVIHAARSSRFLTRRLL